MEFSINRDVFLKALGHANGIIEKKTTLPILSNILIEAKDSKIKITATDLDIIYTEEILPNDLKKEGRIKEKDLTKYNQQNLVFKHKYLEPIQTRKLIKEAYIRYYLRPKTLISLLPKLL